METNNPIVTIEMENGDIIKAELYPNIAPNTVKNFIDLINKNYYDGLIFHRVINGFMIQGGCPEGSGMGGPGYSIAGEFTSNGFTNNLKHERGVLSMARAMNPNSAGSQFFIITAKDGTPWLNGKHTAFGRVVQGMDVCDKIQKVETYKNPDDLYDPKNDRPLADVVITKAYIEKRK